MSQMCAYFRTLNVPNVRILLRHLCAVEAWVHYLHRDIVRLELLREDAAHDVGCSTAHVVAVVAVELLARLGSRVLREAPLARAGLAGDNDHLATRCNLACLVQRVGD